MRIRNVLVFSAAVLAGAMAGSLVGPHPAEAVAREMIELQRDVTTLLQGQKDLTTQITQEHTGMRTIVDQTNSSLGKIEGTMGSLQKSVQDVQANSGARLDTMSTQVQGLSDNLEEIKSRLGKLNQQLVDLQNSVQSIDAKISGTAPAPAEFQEYLKFYADTDLASNAQFYLGEIAYKQKQYEEAVADYDKVLTNYPKSFKLAPARLRKGMALIELGQKTGAVRELREVVRRYPGTEEDRQARAKLKELGVPVTATR
jgi:tol-pal system protein YbgF